MLGISTGIIKREFAMNFRSSLVAKSVKAALLLLPMGVLTACGSADTTDVVTPIEPPPAPAPEEVNLGGGGVKGPMAFANVNVYMIDTANEDFQGTLIASASTNSQASIEGLSLTEPLTPPYLLEIIAVEDTIDITTGEAPIISKLSTVITDASLVSGQGIYATPLTTMAVNLALTNADSAQLPFTGNDDGVTSNEEILAALAVAAEQVKSTLGFGLGSNVDIYDTPPLINDSTDTQEEQASTAAYRSAVEAFSAVVYQMQQSGGDTEATTDDIIANMASDLSDGIIDGSSNGEELDSYTPAALDVLAQDPATLPIPNDPQQRTVSDVKNIVLEETTQTGNTETDTTDFDESEQEVSLQPAEISPDVDGDGVLNSVDAFPEDASADSDNDNDGSPDVAFILVDGVRSAEIDIEKSDNDDDNDGVIDENDAFPLDASEFADTDNDGTGDNSDDDDDGDGVNDDSDDFPLDSTRSSATDQDNDGWESNQDSDDNDASVPEIAFVDTDGDGLADNGGSSPDSDDDNDGVLDSDDAFPLNPQETADLDGDDIGNNADPDIDGDGVANELDLFPYDINEQSDLDGDGIGDNSDTDTDGDGVTNEQEAEDGTNPLLADTDGDGVFDGSDSLPLDPSERFDSDNDGIGNQSDNCILVANFHQLNTDDDEFGDVCDSDDDNDGVLDSDDDYPLDPSLSVNSDADNDGWPTEQDEDDNDASKPGTEFIDTDGDGLGDHVDTDDDNDGVLDSEDALPLNALEWLDTDGDGIGNNSDSDDDGDLVTDISDAFPLDDTESLDSDSDGLGNNADSDDDNDDVLDSVDAFPLDANESIDTDGDNIGNNADLDDDGDEILDTEDLFPLDSNESVDADGDGQGDNADNDDDNDNVVDSEDAFPFDAAESLDTDGDGQGNNADLDDDNDNVNDNLDAFPLDESESLDTDGDDIGNNADTDDDGDTVADSDDAFPLDESEWLDTDGDDIGNNADTDDDGDTVADGEDAFPLDSTESVDTDGDGVGDNSDAFPEDATEWLDTDNDGVGDNADPQPNNPDVLFPGLTGVLSQEPVYSLGSDYDYGDVQYNYEQIAYNVATDTTTINEYVYDFDTMTFKLETEFEADDELVLTGDGWQAYAEDHQVEQQLSDGSTIFSNSQGDKTLVSGIAIDSTTMTMGALLKQYGRYDMMSWSQNLDSLAVFDQNAQLYNVTFTHLTSTYRILGGGGCEEDSTDSEICEFSTLRNYQSEHADGGLTNIEQVFVEQAWLGENVDELQTLYIGSDDDHYIGAELLKSDQDTGIVNLYVFSQTNSEPPRLIAVQGNWSRHTVHSQEMISLDIPQQAVDLIDVELEYESIHRFYALVDGLVRDGFQTEIDSQDEGGDVWFNQSALDQVLANFEFGDTDQDGNPDASDRDDDNDGVDDIDDAFPRNNAEWLDSDGDGIGNNSDTDDDGDGIADNDDLSPNDELIGGAQPLVAADIAESYINVLSQHMVAPAIALGRVQGGVIAFNPDGSGYQTSSANMATFEWALSNDSLGLNYFAGESASEWFMADDLLSWGVLTNEQYNNFKLMNYGDWIKMLVTPQSSVWQLLGSSNDSDRFWVIETNSYYIEADYVRDATIGSHTDDAIIVELPGQEVERKHLSSLEQVAFSSEEVIGQWALPIGYDDSGYLESDLISFAADGTASAQHGDTSFTWLISQVGDLVLTEVNVEIPQTFTYQQTAKFDIGSAVFTKFEQGDSLLTSYSLVIKNDDATPAFNLQSQFLMSSFTLTNPDYYDENGNIKFADYFGFILNSDETMDRIWGENIINGRGTGDWLWHTNNEGNIQFNLNVAYDINSGQAMTARCNTTDEYCNERTRRYWQPLAQSGDRIYVIEWQENNVNGYDFPSEPEWQLSIPARVNYYQVHPFSLDYDNDGINDDVDNDDDNDGIADIDDAFPQDNYEWSDVDGDGLGDNRDTDDDNDGVNDWADELPHDATEHLDSDGDGIGNNADSDDDNDGVIDDIDLAPFNDQVGAALAFDASNLAPKYIELVKGKLQDPTISTGHQLGYAIEFTNGGSGIDSVRTGGALFNWALADDTLVTQYILAEQTENYLQPHELLELGVITQEAYDNFLQNSGDGYVGVMESMLSQQWSLLEDTDDVDRFWIVDTMRYQIIDETHRELLFGSVNAEAVTIEKEGFEEQLTEFSTLSARAFSSEEIVGQWALPINYDPGNEDDSRRLIADLATFNADLTGQTMINSRSFTWAIDSGNLSVTFDNNDVLTFTRFEQYDNGIGVYAFANDTANGKAYSSYSLAVKVDQSSANALPMNQFMMNSFTLTDREAYDNLGDIIKKRYFGFRFEDNNKVSRFLDGDFDLNYHRSGWDRWFWEQQASLITITSFESQNDGLYSNCDVSNDQCNAHRRRHWQVLSQTEDRVYVLEWEFRNHASYEYPSQNDNWQPYIPARVQFYQVFPIDSDGDGINDDIDTDDDNDNALDEDDAFPFDPIESLDTDGDGIGNNSDYDDDNDGINDNNDALPLDENENLDTDLDGIGNNADSDDDGDGVNDINDLSPLDPSIAGGLVFDAVNLAPKYISIVRGMLTDPSISTGHQLGSAIEFNDDGTGQKSIRSGGSAFNWSLVNQDSLAIEYTNEQQRESYLSLTQLLDLGLITQEAMESFQQNSTDTYVGVTELLVSQQWYLLEDSDEIDRFWVVSSDEYQILNDTHRELLWGSVNAEPVVIDGTGEESELIEFSTLLAEEFSESEVIGQWALPIGYDPSNENTSHRLVADLATFDADFTGQTMINSRNFTWEIVAGDLVVTFNDSNTVVTFTRFEQYENGIGIYAFAHDESTGHAYSSYSLAVKVDELASNTMPMDQFMMNSFTLTNSDYYDMNSNIIKEHYFGFRFEANNKVTRFLSGNFNFNEQGEGWDRWFWEQEANLITITSFESQEQGLHATCELSSEQCNGHRRRHWQILSQTEDRVYVLEWEYRNYESHIFPSQGDNWQPYIPARVQFYQTFPIDSDRDGITDDLDYDDDNDNVLDEDDAFPFDPSESSDSDGDGIGDNTDFLKLSDLTFVDATVEQCLADSYGANTPVTNIESFSCHHNELTSLEDLGQLTSLEYLYLIDSNVVDWSALAGLTQLRDLGFRDSNFSDVSLIAAQEIYSLDIVGTDITDISGLSHLTNLRTLTLNNDITDISVFNALTYLDNISLRTMPDDITPLFALSNLTRLRIEGPTFTDLSFLNVIGYNLTGFDLLETLVTDLTPMTNMYNLSWLQMQGNEGVTDISSLAGLTNLQQISFAYSPLLTDMTAISELDNLSDLDISDTGVTDLSSLLTLYSLQDLAIYNLVISDQTQLDLLRDRGVDIYSNYVSPQDISSLQSDKLVDVLTSPVDGTVYTAGQLATITWDSTNMLGSSVRMYVLYDDPSDLGGGANVDLSLVQSRNWGEFASVVTNNGSFDFDPSIMSGSGNAYKLLIVSDEGYWSLSNGTFTLQ